MLCGEDVNYDQIRFLIMSASAVHEVLQVLTILGFVLILPIAGLVIAFLKCIRLTALLLAKIYRRDLRDLVTGRSSGFALDIYYNESPTLPILVTIHLNGVVSLQGLQGEVWRALMHRGLDGHRLTQHITSWLGFFFWTTESNFQIQDHVSLIELEKSMRFRDQVHQIQNELMSKPFETNRSPWKLYLVRSNEESVLILHMHHALGDGYSILNFLVKDLCCLNTPESTATNRPHQSFKSSLNIFVKLLSFPIRAANDLVKALDGIGPHNLFPTSKKASTAPSFKTFVSDPIPWSTFNEMRQKCHVTFTSILASSVGGALRDVVLENGPEAEIPESVTCFTLLPVPGHAEAGFDNHITGYLFQIPLTKLSPTTRLFVTEKNVQHCKESTFPTIFFYLSEVVGLPFHWFTKHFFGNALSTVIASNFVGPPSAMSFQNHQVTECSFVSGLGPGNTCFAISSLSYNGNVQIGVTVNRSCLPGEISPSVFAKRIQSEIHSFTHQLVK